jgi:hypothetical protein
MGKGTSKKVTSPLKQGHKTSHATSLENFNQNTGKTNSIFLRGHQSLIDRAITQSSKLNYQKTIELIDVYAGENSLDEKTRSSLLLKRAILFQQNGDIPSACKAIKLYERLSLKQNQQDIEYYTCKGKLISQVSADPARLSAYLDSISQMSLFINEDRKKELTSLYWRASVLWYTQDMQKSDFYLSTHRGFIDTGSYQNAHNHQLIGLSNIIKIAKEGIPNKNLINTSFDALTQSYSEYVGVHNFRWLNKCIASNLLMMALIDYFARLPIKFYKKIFYVRKLFVLCQIGCSDEAISEIISVIKKLFPEVFEILFSKQISFFIRQHALSEILREIYLDVEYEFLDFTPSQSIDVVALYKRLVS